MTTGSGLDWDGIGTFALTVLTATATAGLPFLAALLWVLWVGLRATDDPGSGLLVVFGKRLVSGQPDADYRARLVTAARLAVDRADQRILILGGRTGVARLTEAEAGERLLRSLPGGAALDIGLEQASADTLTNLRNLRQRLAGTDPRPVTLITNRYHLARVGQTAGSLGLAHGLCAAEGAGAALRLAALGRWPLEAFYVTWFATGKLWAVVTRNRRMLGRVT
jgi:uncharacterized SAM-binding protein YcdF (DUF218 family)